MWRGSVVSDAVRQDVLGFQRALLELRMTGRGSMTMTDEKFKFTPLKPRSLGMSTTVVAEAMVAKAAEKEKEKEVEKPSAEKSVEKPAEKPVEKVVEKSKLDL